MPHLNFTPDKEYIMHIYTHIILPCKIQRKKTAFVPQVKPQLNAESFNTIHNKNIFAFLAYHDDNWEFTVFEHPGMQPLEITRHMS